MDRHLYLDYLTEFVFDNKIGILGITRIKIKMS